MKFSKPWKMAGAGFQGLEAVAGGMRMKTNTQGMPLAALALADAAESVLQGAGM
jgi:hypothetical protein